MGGMRTIDCVWIRRSVCARARRERESQPQEKSRGILATCFSPRTFHSLLGKTTSSSRTEDTARRHVTRMSFLLAVVFAHGLLWCSV